ncbi:MAG: hypothetical protein KGI73_04365 [Patescibacteria group bacterium]|nr:hypothetical protein [Patescibacteria group bacterium]
MIEIKKILGVFETPRLFFTLRGQRASEQVIKELEASFGDGEFLKGLGDLGIDGNGAVFRVFDSSAEIRRQFESGISPHSSVGIFDYNRGSGYFSPKTRTRHEDAAIIPEWAKTAQWAVQVNVAPMDWEDRRREQPAQDSSRRYNFARTCAMQLRADFRKHFAERLQAGDFPWGKRRKKEAPPQQVSLDERAVGDVVRLLNEGPNLAAVVADAEHAAELPLGSRISWVRVPPEPIACDPGILGKVLRAFERFEEICAVLLREKPEVQEILLLGVDLPLGAEFQKLYLAPQVPKFSVRRPDLHWTGTGVFASENDEMPGGFAEIAHVDQSYGANQDRWRKCFDWLTAKGPLLFLVSHEWSKCYVQELAWLAEHMRGKGYPVFLTTTDRMSDLEIGDEVRWQGARLGTVWRQFPIFETEGKTAELVKGAASGAVRMVPEFAHFGNKTWFSLFRRYAGFFRDKLSDEGDRGTFDLLEQIIPDSHLVNGGGSFPCVAAERRIETLCDLRGLPADVRDRLVLKVTGANTLAARSYGVLMGRGLTQATWRGWIDERMRLAQPFIVQRRLETGLAQIPVFNTKLGQAELFGCRILIRPWVVGGELVTAHGCAVPSNTLRVHGRVDMAVLPFRFE